MKCFKNILPIVVLIASSSLFARDVRPKDATTTRSTIASSQNARLPKNMTTTVQPTKLSQPAGQTYAQLVAFIKNSKNVWNNGLIADSFVQDITQKALGANLSSLQLNALLQTAMAFHAQFSNDENKNRAILQNLEMQRNDALMAFDQARQGS